MVVRKYFTNIMSREKYDSVVLKDKNILIEDLLKLLIEDMHLKIYLKFQEQLIGRDIGYINFKLERKKTLK